MNIIDECSCGRVRPRRWASSRSTRASSNHPRCAREMASRQSGTCAVRIESHALAPMMQRLFLTTGAVEQIGECILNEPHPRCQRHALEQQRFRFGEAPRRGERTRVSAARVEIGRRLPIGAPFDLFQHECRAMRFDAREQVDHEPCDVEPGDDRRQPVDALHPALECGTDGAGVSASIEPSPVRGRRRGANAVAPEEAGPRHRRSYRGRGASLRSRHPRRAASRIRSARVRIRPRQRDVNLPQRHQRLTPR